MCCYMDDEPGCLIISGADMGHAYAPCPELLGMDPIVEPFLCADSSTNSQKSSALALMDHNVVGTELEYLMQEGLIDQDPPKVDMFDQLAACGGFVEDHMFEGCALDLQNDNFHQAAAAAAATAAAFSDMESSQDPLKTLDDLIRVTSSMAGSANEQLENSNNNHHKSDTKDDLSSKNMICEMGFPPVPCEILMSGKSSMSAASSTSNSSDKNEFSSGFHVGNANCSLDDTTATSLQGAVVAAAAAPQLAIINNLDNEANSSGRIAWPVNKLEDSSGGNSSSSFTWGAPAAAFSFQDNQQGLFSVDSVATTSCSKPISSLPQAGMGTMRETLYRMAVWRPIATTDSLSKPKRRNVKISSDPQTVAARHRRERISTKIRTLQRLVPGGTKMDTASMLDEAIHYVKYLKSQVRAMELLEQSGDSSRNPASGMCQFYPQSNALLSSSSSFCWPMDNIGAAAQQVNISGY